MTVFVPAICALSCTVLCVVLYCIVLYCIVLSFGHTEHDSHHSPHLLDTYPLPLTLRGDQRLEFPAEVHCRELGWSPRVDCWQPL